MSIMVIKILLGVLCVLVIIKNIINIRKLKKEYSENKFFLPKKLKRKITKSLNKMPLLVFTRIFLVFTTILCLLANENSFTMSIILFLYIYFIYILYYEKIPIFKKIEKARNKNNIMAISKNIEDNLSVFANSSQFKIRILNELSVIKEIISNNLKLKSTIKDKDLKEEIVLNEKHIFKSLKEILRLLIQYNNDRNELIFEEINKNIEILNKIKGEI